MVKKEDNKNMNNNNNDLNKGKKDRKSIWSYILLVLIAILIVFTINNVFRWLKYKDTEVPVSDLVNKFLDWKYSEVLIEPSKAIATLSWQTVEENWAKRQLRDTANIPKNATHLDLWLVWVKSTVVKYSPTQNTEFWSSLITNIIFFVLILILGLLFIGKMWWMANSAMTFWKSRARLYDPTKDKITFKDVAWADDEKEELQEVVQFLKNPKKFKELWAKIPKWVLLVGPPWTWKTMLARAVAWESWVPFLSISGSEFVEMFVWVWASRVRDLFWNAKKIAPAIIFIDEIDAIGKKRWPWTWGWHDEREQTLNQILTEMDWFDNDTNIIVMWATNRVDVLDKALLRPGRFDRRITVNLPNLADREEILKIHASTRKVEKDIDFKSLASKTVGFSGADLWNLINEAAIITARYNEKQISWKRIDEAFERIVMWLRKKSQVMNDLEKRITAYHEVWHAIVWKLLPNTDPVHKVSIVSRGWALWVTWFLPERDELLVSKAKYLDELASLYGWRAAEEIFFWKDNITTWASNDIERATSIARKMVTKYWMIPEIWAENFEWDVDRYSWDTKRPFVSNQTIENIDKTVKEILKDAYNTAIKIITENKDLHDKIAKDLLEKEELSKEEFDTYFA